MLKMQLPFLVSVVGQEQEEGIRNEPFLELINASSGFNPDFFFHKVWPFVKTSATSVFAGLPGAGAALWVTRGRPLQLLWFLREPVLPRVNDRLPLSPGRGLRTVCVIYLGPFLLGKEGSPLAGKLV